MPEWLWAFDRAGVAAAQALQGGAFARAMAGITRLGDMGLIWIAVGLALLASKKWRKQGFVVLVALLLGAIVGNLLLKPMVARPRPFEAIEGVVPWLIAPPVDYSFPSGHTLSSFAAAGALRRVGGWRSAAAWALAVTIALSRLCLTVHYPTDVIAGAAIGVICAFTAERLCEIVCERKYKK